MPMIVLSWHVEIDLQLIVNNFSETSHLFPLKEHNWRLDEFKYPRSVISNNGSLDK